MPRFAVCILLYGDHPELASRCLRSLARPGFKEQVARIQIGLNNVSDQSRTIACEWAHNCGVPVTFHQPDWCGRPALKYPLMRSMLRDNPQDGRTVMWFDDDSYVAADGFWTAAAEMSAQHSVLGQLMRREMNANQWQWIQTQWWCDKSLPFRNQFVFPQGAWLAVSRELLQRCDWPLNQLRHCGGDAMFGEMLRHLRVEICPWRIGVRINADASGRDSTSQRRGYTESLLAWDYAGQPLDTTHNFVNINRWSVTCSE